MDGERRLRDGGAPDAEGDEQAAAELLRADGPLRPPPAWKAQGRAVVFAGARQPIRPRWPAGGLAAGAMALIVVGMAWAWSARQARPLTVKATDRPAVPGEGRDGGTAAVPPLAAVRGSSSPVAQPPRGHPPPAAPRPAPAAHPRAAAAADEATLVHAALRSLRAGDVDRALVLAEDYLERFPDGLLVEEAWVVALDAAIARGDDSATERARGYLARFPAGRFRTRVAQTLEPKE